MGSDILINVLNKIQHFLNMFISTTDPLEVYEDYRRVCWVLCAFSIAAAPTGKVASDNRQGYRINIRNSLRIIYTIH